MSSPPRDIPTSDLDDVEMQLDEGSVEQSMPGAPAAGPLFLEGTPSIAGTPRHNSVARRAMGLSTPRRQKIPLFARKFVWFPAGERLHLKVPPSWYLLTFTLPELISNKENACAR